MWMKLCAVRPVSLLLVATVTLGACESGTAGNTAGLSPDQQTLRSESSKFNQTVAVPAVIGALGGATLGAILCKNNKAACAAGGAAAGGLLGGGAGYLVARKNTQAASREDAIRIRAQAAQEDIARFDRVIAATNGVIAQHRQEVRTLKAAYRKDATSLSGARQEEASISADIQSLRHAIAANEERVSAITSDVHQFGSEGTQLARERDNLLEQQQTMQAQLKKLLGLEKGIPTV